ncbi:MAG: carboxypeptidase-like regulatory domain-containing protein [Elusimicrobiota bacterium]
MKKKCPICEAEVEESSESCTYCKRVFAPGDFAPKPDRPDGPPDDDLEERSRAPSIPRRVARYIYPAAGTLALALVFLARDDVKWLASSKLASLRESMQPESPPEEPRSPPGRKPPEAKPSGKPGASPEKPSEPTSVLATGRHIPKSAARFIIQGTVFEVTTLKRVAKARLFFIDRDTKERYHTVTNSKGFYQASLQARAGGYRLSIRHPAYNATYTEDWIPSIRTYGEEKRAEFALDLAGQPPAIDAVFGTDGQRLEKDFAVAPLKKRR